MIRVRQAFQDHMLLIVAVAMLLNGYLSVVVARQQRDFMEQWAAKVGVIAEWQGPDQLRTSLKIDGDPADFTIQEARGFMDVENLVNRKRDSLKRIAKMQEH